MTDAMTDERLAAIRLVAKMTPDRLLDATIAEIDRLREAQERFIQEAVKAASGAATSLIEENDRLRQRIAELEYHITANALAGSPA